MLNQSWPAAGSASQAGHRDEGDWANRISRTGAPCFGRPGVPGESVQLCLQSVSDCTGSTGAQELGQPCNGVHSACWVCRSHRCASSSWTTRTASSCGTSRALSGKVRGAAAGQCTCPQAAGAWAHADHSQVTSSRSWSQRGKPGGCDSHPMVSSRQSGRSELAQLVHTPCMWHSSAAAPGRRKQDMQLVSYCQQSKPTAIAGSAEEHMHMVHVRHLPLSVTDNRSSNM